MLSEKILIVDDDVMILEMLYEALSDVGYLVYKVSGSEEAMKWLKVQPNLIILDVMMPGLNGFDFCKEIRDVVTCPIIFLTAKASENELIEGLASGGDDYITKPFSLRELRARVSAHLRRQQRNPDKAMNFLVFKDFKINLKSREVYFKNELLSLTKREFDILELLTLNPNQVFSKDQIYDKIWGLEAEGDAQTVAEHIKKIRAKCLRINEDFNYLQTVWGVGYKWDTNERGRIEGCLKSIH